MDEYRVKKLKATSVDVSVPASKSVLARALALGAFSQGDVLLSECGDFGQDGDEMISCLSALGIATEASRDGLLVHGRKDFRRHARLDVGSAGTAARFLPAILAFFGGDYEFHASEQMTNRPMAGLFSALRSAGVRFEFFARTDHFPFRMVSDGIASEILAVDTAESTQFASALLLAAALGDRERTLRLSGFRAGGSYIRMTETLLRAFGADVHRRGAEMRVTPICRPTERFSVPPDVSSACYFYALSLLLGCKVRVRGVRRDGLQGDFKFLDLLGARGVTFSEDGGVVADGRNVSSFEGFDVDLSDFSDQTPTLAALAPFATSPTRLRNVGHIRYQESDRIRAIVQNLTALGVRTETDGQSISVFPAESLAGNRVDSFGDHRIAMAFSLIGLKTGNLTVHHPDCCRKTFKNFFGILDSLTNESGNRDPL